MSENLFSNQIDLLKSIINGLRFNNNYYLTIKNEYEFQNNDYKKGFNKALDDLEVHYYDDLTCYKDCNRNLDIRNLIYDTKSPLQYNDNLKIYDTGYIDALDYIQKKYLFLIKYKKDVKI